MNEAELIAKTIEVGQSGWTHSYLTHPEENKHCLLGMIGAARWGNQWDVDCRLALDGLLPSTENDERKLYQQLLADPTTRSLIIRIGEAIKTITPEEEYEGFLACRGSYEDAYLNAAVFGWNDDQDDGEAVFELLEKVQAEIGVLQA